MRELVEHIVMGIVDDPTAVEVSEVEHARGKVVRVRVAPEDVGKVIGRNGRVARAVRILARAAARRRGRDAVMVEIEGG
ncbi:MAG: KH domain-containing protein [Armatimonadota bacterium]|nr:KH domain-containing protein [Armatimonadota bacterium]MDR5697953.1 KH domain-containing protein [Armatimonadota bacterium]